MTLPESRDTKTAQIAYPAALLVIAVVLGAPEIFVPPSLDQGILAYIGADILDGGVPYLTNWDHKPPGSHYLYALGFLVFGKSVEAIRLLDGVYIYGAALATYWLTHKLFNRLAGFFAGALLLILYATRLSWWSKSEPDEYMLLPMLLYMGLAIMDPKRKRKGHDLLAGFFLGAAFITKYVAVVAVAPVLCWLLWDFLSTRQGKRILRGLLLQAGAFVFAVGALVLYLFFAGSLNHFIESQAVFNAGYVLHGFRGDASMIWLVVTLFQPFVALPLAVFALLTFLPQVSNGPLFRERLGMTGRSLTFTLVLSIVLALEVIAQAKFYTYHLIPLLVPLSILAGLGLSALYQLAINFVTPHAPGLRWLPAAIAAVVLLATIVPHHRRQFDKYPVMLGFLNGTQDREAYYANFGGYGDGGGFSYLACFQAAEYLRAHTGPSDSIYVWSFDPLLPFLAQRKMPTRFTYNTPLIVPWSLPKWREEFLRELKRSPPLYFVFLHNDAHPWTTARSEDSHTLLPDVFPELDAYINSKYELEASIEDYRILRRRENPGVPPPGP